MPQPVIVPKYSNASELKNKLDQYILNKNLAEQKLLQATGKTPEQIIQSETNQDLMDAQQRLADVTEETQKQYIPYLEPNLMADKLKISLLNQINQPSLYNTIATMAGQTIPMEQAKLFLQSNPPSVSPEEQMAKIYNIEGQTRSEALKALESKRKLAMDAAAKAGQNQMLADKLMQSLTSMGQKSSESSDKSLMEALKLMLQAGEQRPITNNAGGLKNLPIKQTTEMAKMGESISTLGSLIKDFDKYKNVTSLPLESSVKSTPIYGALSEFFPGRIFDPKQYALASEYQARIAKVNLEDAVSMLKGQGAISDRERDMALKLIASQQTGKITKSNLQMLHDIMSGGYNKLRNIYSEQYQVPAGISPSVSIPKQSQYIEKKHKTSGRIGLFDQAGNFVKWKE